MSMCLDGNVCLVSSSCYSVRSSAPKALLLKSIDRLLTDIEEDDFATMRNFWRFKVVCSKGTYHISYLLKIKHSNNNWNNNNIT